MSAPHKWIDENKEIIPLSSNEFETPASVFNYFNLKFNFEWDLAARIKNKKCEKALCVDEGTDSLSVDWHKLGDSWLWLNPPYSPLKPWIQKTQKEHLLGAKIALLIPPILTTKYFSVSPPDEIILIGGRIKFVGANGIEMKSNSHDSCVCFFGKRKKTIVSYLSLEEINERTSNQTTTKTKTSS